MTEDYAREFTTEDLSEEHERLGSLTTKLVADYTRALDTLRLCSEVAPVDLEKLFDESLPREGMDAEKIFAQFA